jgi:starch phosphorylase
MHVLLDSHHLDWDRAWDITQRTFSYTNHTLMPEALETWPVGLFEEILPRHLQIIYEINYRFLEEVRHRFPGDTDVLRRMSIVDEAGGRRLRMAHLAIAGSHKVNGVSQIHTDLMKKTIFADFDRFFPGKIINITNGVTPRRWLHLANPGLSGLITSRIGKSWVSDLDDLRKLVPFVQDAALRAQFRAVKTANKEWLAKIIKMRLKLTVDPASMFDVQIKRIHEYKRQLMNVLHVVTRYNRIREGRVKDMVSRTVLFGGKAAPGYTMAKLIIKLIHSVADVVNNDPAACNRLKVAFIPDYNVSNAEKIIPACDLSEQISTAGTEASGTSNMKFGLNGALTIGTLDGANIEIKEEVGDENIFIFGLTADEVSKLRAKGYYPWDIYQSDMELKQTLDMIAGGYFSPEAPDIFRPIFEALTRDDRFMVLADYGSYISCQERVDELYKNPEEWSGRALLNIAGMGKFSSDRTIREYAEEIWNVKPVKGK